MNPYYTNALAPLFKQPAKGAKHFDIPPFGVVEVQVRGDYALATYHGVTGYIPSSLIEPYERGLAYAVLELEGQTPSTDDFEQYLYHKGVKQVNLCGEMCVAYLSGIPLSELLAVWERTQPPFYRRVFGEGRARGTWSYELVELLAIAGVNAVELQTVKDPYLNRARYTVHGLQGMAGRVITACRISPATGRLNGSGVGHWVVVTNVAPERCGALVTVYNPAPNCFEQYSWAEFIASASQPNGALTQETNAPH